MQLKDVQAGAYFKLTPNVRVGASAGVAGQSDLAPRRASPSPSRRACGWKPPSSSKRLARQRLDRRQAGRARAGLSLRAVQA
jgi:hypothetical protein